MPAPSVAIPSRKPSSRELQAHAAGRSSSISPSQQLEATPEDIAGPPTTPPYSDVYGEIQVQQEGIGTRATTTENGRVNININQRDSKLSSLITPALGSQWMTERGAVPGFAIDVPSMNIVIQVVGSQGDVEPFVALGLVLKQKHGHRVRIATHPQFKASVEEYGLEFFSLGAESSNLAVQMAFPGKNLGLIPGMDSFGAIDVKKRWKEMWEMVHGAWRSCIAIGNGIPEDDDACLAAGCKPFVADAIIANPSSLGHIHFAEKLGIPLHMMFTIPWSPTQVFPHPLANIQSSNAENSITNLLSYALVDMLTWQGLSDLINKLREKTLALEPLSSIWAPGIISRLKVPCTYCWSPQLIPTPQDWPPQIDVSGFFFLPPTASYGPPEELVSFLAAEPPPVYIGFGSIVVEDPNALTNIVLTAVKLSGVRAVIFQSWGDASEDLEPAPEGVFFVDNFPHDWLFQRCRAVVHHGGAGTTAAGIKAGKPTVIVPFFGDQPFWGSVIARAGAGPNPIPYDKLTAETLADGIMKAVGHEMKSAAENLGVAIYGETGVENGAVSFHRALAGEPQGVSRCDVFKDRAAVWIARKSGIRLSALAASILINNGVIKKKNKLKLYRHKEWFTDEGPWEPISGAMGALMGTISSIMMGMGDFTIEPYKLFTAVGRKNSKKKATETDQASIAEVEGREVTGDGLSTIVEIEGKEIGERRQSIGSSTSGHSMDSNACTSSPSFPLKLRTSISTVSSLSRASTLGPHSAVSSVSSASFLSRTFSMAGPAQSTANIDDKEWEASYSRNSASLGSRIVDSEALKSSTEFSLGLTRSIRRAPPRLHGDTTVRREDKATGLISGLKVADKEFSLGMYDGVAGTFTQPSRNARRDSTSGLLKGFAIGITGAALKPVSSSVGVVAYTMKGMYRSWLHMTASDIEGYVTRSRIIQGEMEMAEAGKKVAKEALKTWSSLCNAKKTKRKKGKEKATAITPETSTPAEPINWSLTPSIPDIPELPANEVVITPVVSPSPPPPPPPPPPKNALEDAIRQTVAAISSGNEDEDKVRRQTLRAILAKLQGDGGDDEVLEGVIKEATGSVERLSGPSSSAPLGILEDAVSPATDLAESHPEQGSFPEVVAETESDGDVEGVIWEEIIPAEEDTAQEEGIAHREVVTREEGATQERGIIIREDGDYVQNIVQRAFHEGEDGDAEEDIQEESPVERTLREGQESGVVEQATREGEDEQLQRALRESQERGDAGHVTREEEEVQQALRESQENMNNNVEQLAHEEAELLQRVLRESQEANNAGHPTPEETEILQRVLRESQEDNNAHEHPTPEEAELLQRVLRESQEHDNAEYPTPEEAELLQRVLRESQEDDLQRALRESHEEEQRRQEELQRKQDEDDAILRYMIRQSQEEEALRRVAGLD